MKPRQYRLKQRAERQDRTRERIVDAAIALHEELGPANTTISAVAERAGVQRLTVYRHFPSDRELFTACTGKWLELNTPPDISKIEHGDPQLLTRNVLGALYRYYRRTAGMWTAAYRDAGKVPALADPMEKFAAYLATIRKDLLRELDPPKASKRQVGAALGHAVRFSTWQSLSDQHLTDAAMARLVTAWMVASFDA